MDIIYSTASALYVAFFGGLGYLAIRYPETFRSIGSTIANVMAGFFMIAAAYYLGASSGGLAVMPFVSDGNLKAAQIALEHSKPNLLLFGLGLLAPGLFIIVMGLIGFRLEAEKAERGKKDGEPE